METNMVGTSGFKFAAVFMACGLAVTSASRAQDTSVAVETPFVLLSEASEPSPPASDSEAELAKKTLNPVADLYSVPFQYNQDFNIGPKNATKKLLNIQPVIPIGITQDWNLIIRTIVPIVEIGSVATGVDSQSGLGDITQSFFFSPKQPTHGWIWGAGPAFLYPSGTDGLSGRKWGVGPTGVALRQENGWTYGILANHIWSFAGDDDTANVNATFLQPFLSYTFKTYTSITINSETTYDWNEDQAIVPVNLLVSQILKIGKLPISLQAGPRIYLDGPSGNADWGFRVNLTLLFPK